MSHWNHRVVKEVLSDGTDWYSIREVFYNDDGSIYGYTEYPTNISGESIEDMRKSLLWILRALDDPILIDGEVEFKDAPWEEDEQNEDV